MLFICENGVPGVTGAIEGSIVVDCDGPGVIGVGGMNVSVILNFDWSIAYLFKGYRPVF